jgi:hypothetical protein
MKKHYISPEVLCDEMCLDSLLAPASITSVSKGSLTNDIPVGGDAGDGVVSDSRRQRDIWADEDDEGF